MDWIAALCLSVPLALGIAFGAFLVYIALDNAVTCIVRALVDATEVVIREGLHPKTEEPPPGEPSIFDKWLAAGGNGLPQSVQDSVEWAIGRLKGEESDDQGTAQHAEKILAHYGPGVIKAIADEMAAGA